MSIITLIGMPGCGKTTVSQSLAQQISYKFYDSDIELEKNQGIAIKDIFAVHGEDYFRKLETETIHTLLNYDKIVLAVGGGAIIRNAEALCSRSTVIYLRRSIKSIVSTLDRDTRPLLKAEDSLIKLFNERKELYENSAQFTVDNEGSVDEAVQKILTLLKKI